MLSKIEGEVGKTLHLKGYAVDVGHRIEAVEFSLDAGEHWTCYRTPETNDYQVVTWYFDFTPPQEGLFVLLVRSVNDEGKRSPEPDHVEIVARECDAARFEGLVPNALCC